MVSLSIFSRLAIGFYSFVAFASISACFSFSAKAQTFIDARTVASQMAGQTWYYEDRGREYFLPNGSSYLYQDGKISYHRWYLQGSKICFSGLGQECASLSSLGGGQVALNNSNGSVRVLGKRTGDADQLVRRYGLGMRSAIDTGSLRLARSTGPDRDDPLGHRRLYRFSDEALVADDGTVGRFTVAPSGVPTVIPNANAVAPSAQPTVPRPTVVQPTPVVRVDRPQPSQPAPQAATVQAQTQILFSRVVDKDPGCYLHKSRCNRRCAQTKPEISLIRETRAMCQANCQRTYICAR